MYNIQIRDEEHALVVSIDEDAGVVEDEQALHVAASAQVGGEAGAVLPGEVTQEAESTHQSLQEPEGHLTGCRAQRLWRRTAHKMRQKTKNGADRNVLTPAAVLPSSSRGRIICVLTLHSLQ